VARIVLDPATAPAVGELVRRDPVQPCQRRPLIWPVAVGRQQSGGEHLGGEVGGQLRVAGPAKEEAQHRREVALVERHEGLRVTARVLRQEIVVVHHHPVSRAGRLECDKRAGHGRSPSRRNAHLPRPPGRSVAGHRDGLPQAAPPRRIAASRRSSNGPAPRPRGAYPGGGAPESVLRPCRLTKRNARAAYRTGPGAAVGQPSRPLNVTGLMLLNRWDCLKVRKRTVYETIWSEPGRPSEARGAGPPRWR
jgi:hypothetical protein